MSQVRIANGFEKAQAADALRRRWREPIVVRGRSYRFDDCEMFVAGDMAGIAAVSHDEPPFMELVAINAFSKWQGVGSALIEAIAASASRRGSRQSG